MGRNEALAVLGLNDDATEEDITNAHRKLIQKLHPDRAATTTLQHKSIGLKTYCWDSASTGNIAVKCLHWRADFLRKDHYHD